MTVGYKLDSLLLLGTDVIKIDKESAETCVPVFI